MILQMNVMIHPSTWLYEPGKTLHDRSGLRGGNVFKSGLRHNQIINRLRLLLSRYIIGRKVPDTKRFIPIIRSTPDGGIQTGFPSQDLVISDYIGSHFHRDIPIRVDSVVAQRTPSKYWIIVNRIHTRGSIH
ncbi:MAG: hypothetical protein BWY82_01755 [Verrucomicrobia bacterium ADurb.Bin474]|nr:MAG: hypothetical protein BWY82_01755 [Verrucomicrobia bacterium ADurb.Bin474]